MAKKIPHDLRFTVMADCIRIGGKGSEANGKPATEAQFASTFSNRVFSRSKPATVAPDDGKRKFKPSPIERRPRGIFPTRGRCFIRALKASWSPRSRCPLLHAVQWLCADTKRRSHILHVSA